MNLSCKCFSKSKAEIAFPQQLFRMQIGVVVLTWFVVDVATGYCQQPTQKAVRDLIYSACLSVHKTVEMDEISNELSQFEPRSQMDMTRLASVLERLGIVVSCEQRTNATVDDLIPPCLVGVMLYDSRYQGESNDVEHFVLLLGYEGNKMLVVDPHTTPDEVSKMDPRGIFSFWNGAKIRLYESRFEWFSSLVLQYRLVVVSILIGLVAIIYRRSFSSLIKSRKHQAMMVFFFTILVFPGCKNSSETSVDNIASKNDEKTIAYFAVSEPPELNLGALKIDKSTVVSCRLKLRLSESNTGTRISRIQTSCKCIKIDAEQIVGEPFDENQTLEVPFDIEFTSQSGEFKQTIQFTFNQDESTSILVPISAFLSNVPNALIKTIVFHADVSEKKGMATAVFTRARMASDAKLGLLKVESGADVEVRVASQKLVSPALPNLEDRRLDSLEVTLQLTHDMLLGAHSLGDLKFFWTSNTIPSITLPGKLVHEHVLSASPKNIFYRGNVGDPIEGEFKLHGDQEYFGLAQSFRASSNLDSLQLSFETSLSNDGELTVSYRGTSAANAVRVQGEVSCEFGAELPALKIPIKFLIH